MRLAWVQVFQRRVFSNAERLNAPCVEESVRIGTPRGLFRFRATELEFRGGPS